MIYSKWLAPSIFALAGLLSFPGTAAQADIASMLAANLTKGESWRSFMVDAPAGSIHQEELVFANHEDGSLPKTRG